MPATLGSKVGLEYDISQVALNHVGSLHLRKLWALLMVWILMLLKGKWTISDQPPPQRWLYKSGVNLRLSVPKQYNPYQCGANSH